MMADGRGASLGVDAMNIEMTSPAEADEDILTFDIPDAVLERAGFLAGKPSAAFQMIRSCESVSANM
jgi:hypothetical protein